LTRKFSKFAISLRSIAWPSSHWPRRLSLVARDESRILLKRSLEKKSGDLVWIDLPPALAAALSGHDIPISQPQPISILHGLSFRDFAISPDGRSLAVVITGKRNLLVFPLPSR